MSSYLGIRFKRIRRLRTLARLVRMKGIYRRGKKTRFHKQDRGRMKGIFCRGKKTRFHKQDRGRMKGISCRVNSIPFDRYGYALQALEPARIPVRQIEAGRWTIEQYLRSRGKLWVLPQKPPTITTTESHWDDSDKKNPRLIISKYSVYVISPGDILYEISGVSETIARRALPLAASIMPIQTQFFYIITC